MASIAIKAVATLATAGAIGGVTYGVHTLNDTTDTVRNYLTKNGFEVIEQNQDDLWTKLHDAYQFEKIDGLTLTPESKDGIKALCKDTLEKTIKSKEENDYINATKLCVKFETIAEKLKGKEFEKTASKLNEKLESFIQKIKEEINKVVADGTDKVGNQIKTWCEKNAKRRNSEENKTYLEQIEKNCLVSK